MWTRIDIIRYNETRQEVNIKMPEKLLKVPELAKVLGVSRSHIYVLIDRGLPLIKVGGNTRFDFEAVMQWLKEEQKPEVSE